jgi:hypothetical protein
MKPKPSKLYEVTVMRTAITWDKPIARASDEEGILAIVKTAVTTPFQRIEICDVSHWNEPEAASVTFTEDCPRLGNFMNEMEYSIKAAGGPPCLAPERA